MDLLLSELLPDEIAGYLRASELAYFEEVYYYLPPVIDFSEAAIRKDKQRLLLVYDSVQSEKAHRKQMDDNGGAEKATALGLRLQDLIPVLERLGSVETWDLSRKPIGGLSEVRNAVSRSSAVVLDIQVPQFVTIVHLLGAYAETPVKVWDSDPCSPLRYTAFGLECNVFVENPKSEALSVREKAREVVELLSQNRPFCGRAGEFDYWQTASKAFALERLDEILASEFRREQTAVFSNDARSHFSWIIDTVYGSVSSPIGTGGNNGKDTSEHFRDNWSKSSSLCNSTGTKAVFAFLKACADPEIESVLPRVARRLRQGLLRQLAARLIVDERGQEGQHNFSFLMIRYEEWLGVCDEVIERIYAMDAAATGLYVRLAFAIAKSTTSDAKIEATCRNGFLEAALEFLDKDCRLERSGKKHPVLKGGILAELGRIEEAEAYVEDTYRNDRSAQDGFSLIGDALYRGGDPANAFLKCRRDFEERRQSRNQMVNYCKLLAREGRIEESKQLLVRAYEEKRGVRGVLTSLVLAVLEEPNPGLLLPACRLGRFTQFLECIDLLKSEISYQGDGGNTYNVLVKLLAFEGREEEAIRAMEDGIRKHPTIKFGFMQVALWLWCADWKEGAGNALVRECDHIQKQPDLLGLHSFAVMSLLCGCFETGMTQFMRFRSIDENFLQTRESDAWFWWIQGLAFREVGRDMAWKLSFRLMAYIDPKFAPLLDRWKAQDVAHHPAITRGFEKCLDSIETNLKEIASAAGLTLEEKCLSR